ncbi:hypothetical protein LSH36_454g00002 [Paralvinella palmiformis]|uniref:Phenazine biosynthesis-like domain-containing protein n=1 Tax=Paralvinella palmiformis TaxID=53620 RepID=A0AAD9JAX8_9ANNE|nr:hypothetical protein LSH36_454g00002 [Paralvinella palmiformis]
MENKKICYLPMYIVDAFTSHPFAGNPAAVCLVDSSTILTDDIRQNIAKEMNLSETAFIEQYTPDESFSESNHFKLRWFTPAKEVMLCGHATLASSAVLFECVKNKSDKLIFETLSGQLTARKQANFISLMLPLNPPRPFQLVLPDPEQNIQAILYSSSTKKLLIRIKDCYTRSFIEQLKPQTDKMMSAHNTGKIAGVIVTLCTKAQEQYDFVSRYFAPWVGIPEDPVTGSAHTVLAPYWSDELGKKKLFAYQCSPRGGELRLTVKDDQRLEVAGTACVVLNGQFLLQ